MDLAICVIFCALALMSSMAPESDSIRVPASRIHPEISFVFSLVWVLLSVRLTSCSFTWETSPTSSDVDFVCSMEA